MEVTREPESADHVLPLFRSNNNKHFSSFKSIHHCRCFVLAIRKWWETDLHNQIINQTDQHNWSDRYNPYQYRSTLLTAFRLEYISFWSHRWKYVIFSSVMRTGEGGGFFNRAHSPRRRSGEKTPSNHTQFTIQNAGLNRDFSSISNCVCFFFIQLPPVSSRRWSSKREGERGREN